MDLVGKNVIIKETEKCDLENIMSLWNNGEVMKWVNFPNGLNMTHKKINVWYDKLINNDNRHHFVVLTKDLTFCGEVYYGVNPIGKRAVLDIKFLPKFQGKGLATEALMLLIGLVFDEEIEVNAVWTEPNLGNNAAMNLYARCGLEPTIRPKDLDPHDSYYELTKKKWMMLSNI